MEKLFDGVLLKVNDKQHSEAVSHRGTTAALSNDISGRHIYPGAIRHEC